MTGLSQFFAQGRSDPAIALLARTTAAVRAAPDFVQGPEDFVGGASLDQESPSPLDPGSLTSVLERIDRSVVLDTRADRLSVRGARAAEIARLPSPVREAAFTALETGRWRFGGFGIRRLPLTTGDGAFAELMRIEPGRGVPDHDHGDDEATLILTGGYHDGHDHYGPGDVSLAKPGFSHTPKADPGEVCYVLAVSYGPPRLAGPYRLLQRLLAEPAEARAVWRSR